MLLNKLTRINFTPLSFIEISRISAKFQINSKINFSTSKQEEKNSKLEELKTNWTAIYKFPKIRSVHVLSKLKNYQLATTVCAIPVSFITFPDQCLLVLYSAFALSCSLSFGSFLLKDSIGFIYAHNTEKNLVRIAYLNFWGTRKDEIFEISDIVPFSELPKNFTDRFYTTLKFNNNHKDLKLLSKNYEILDPEKFTEIFG
ncbi:hypothetical protein PVAND_017312 [Polypedilum vanderplanki]|uniref:Transmembrane protein 186 n=1 Tax=Polypedilum vanderplanki TaxID=319348 RepID=A0A9J6BHQ4_POLVA|nr:hypothetical protein PVAND_017312 [Polypedilum vanderplanki]